MSVLHECELSEPVDLTLPSGRLNPTAVGWTRTPLHRTDGIGYGRVAVHGQGPRPSGGRLVVDGATYDIADGAAWATLDHGRGRWPYTMSWNWVSGSGIVDGRAIGLQVGGKWTDGTGLTENAIIVDGQLTKISEDLWWEYSPRDWMAPWRIQGGRST